MVIFHSRGETNAGVIVIIGGFCQPSLSPAGESFSSGSRHRVFGCFMGIMTTLSGNRPVNHPIRWILDQPAENLDEKQLAAMF